MFDIFNNDAFNLITMTNGLQEVKYVPSYITKLGLFETESIDTLAVAIEKQTDESLILVPYTARGTHGTTMGSDLHNIRDLRVPHQQINDTIMADRVQGVRQFNTERQVLSLQSFIAGRAVKARRSFELTDEFQKLALITTGKLLDTDGSVKYDYYAEFGDNQAAEIDFDLDNATPAKGFLRAKVDKIRQDMGLALDGIPFGDILIICGNNFWNDLIIHKEMYDLYLGWSAAPRIQIPTISGGNQSAQTGIWGELDAFGAKWVNYRGGQNVSIDPDKCYIVPFGVPDLFKTVYAPADYIETVNTPGLPLYAFQWVMPNRKGVNLEFQTNRLHYCTRPRVLMRGKRT